MGTPPSRDGGQEESQTGCCRREPDSTAGQRHSVDSGLRLVGGDGCPDLPWDRRRWAFIAGWNFSEARLRESRPWFRTSRSVPLLGERSPVGTSCRACVGGPEVERLELALPAAQLERPK